MGSLALFHLALIIPTALATEQLVLIIFIQKLEKK